MASDLWMESIETYCLWKVFKGSVWKSELSSIGHSILDLHGTEQFYISYKMLTLLANKFINNWYYSWLLTGRDWALCDWFDSVSGNSRAAVKWDLVVDSDGFIVGLHTAQIGSGRSSAIGSWSIYVVRLEIGILIWLKLWYKDWWKSSILQN